MRGRVFFIAAAVAAMAIVSGCTTNSTQFASAYKGRSDGGYALPSIPLAKVERQYRRQIVDYATKEKPGTIIVDTDAKFLHLVLEGGKAMRYGIGVGREGFEWSGVAKVGWKREWPTWTPPAAMIKRQPELAKYRGGMKPGLTNPLGARALYLMRNGRDTGYRLHGTPEWWSIGGAVSSGCIRLMNQDIIDLYERVQPGAKVIVS
ncbi:L,D-transpeptidase [Oricola cellulosilytica]|uniref:L,D-transpeptidase n=1 Tax=Oricola cellulosilytica TaxID=1429082 RepID=A0A4R0PER1_9HYPH|nr:L,D-transpeptidase [Oricola cellulosilytica]TCD16296.1 L,D-transpeptidase [Oricola cellulosilytica]